jgi:hypothetical protein
MPLLQRPHRLLLTALPRLRQRLLHRLQRLMPQRPPLMPLPLPLMRLPRMLPTPARLTTAKEYF